MLKCQIFNIFLIFWEEPTYFTSRVGYGIPKKLFLKLRVWGQKTRFEKDPVCLHQYLLTKVWSPGHEQKPSMSVWLPGQEQLLFTNIWSPIQEQLLFRTIWSPGQVQTLFISVWFSRQAHTPWTNVWLFGQAQILSSNIWPPGQPSRWNIKNNEVAVKKLKRR